MAGQQLAHVLDADVALDHRLAEVAQRGGTHDRQTVERAQQRRGVEQRGEEDRPGGGAGDQRPTEALPGLLRRDRRRHRVSAEQHARGVAPDVAADNRRDVRRDPPRAIRWHGQQRHEAEQERHIRGGEGRRGHVAQVILDGTCEPPHQAREDGEHERDEQLLGALAVGEHDHCRPTDDERDERRRDAERAQRVPDLPGPDSHGHDQHDDEQPAVRREQRHRDERAEPQPDADRDREVAAGPARRGRRRCRVVGRVKDGHQTSSSSASLCRSSSSTLVT